MEWIRRNWPDLLIGLALLAVIGGIIATLLNGGNFLSTNRNVSVNTPSNTSVSSGGSTTPSTTPISPELPSGTATISSTTGEETTGIITPIIDAPSTETLPEAATSVVENTVEAVTEAATETSTAPAPVASSSTGTSYRISVGAFGSAENAERRAETFKSAGYPVFVGKQGDLSLVLIGPYENQATAQQAVSQIQNSGLEANPIIYEFTPATPGNSSSSASTSDTPAPTTQTTATSTETLVSLPTSNTGRYIQVGAYGSVESARPQLLKLQGLGFSVTYIEEGGKIKLLVGPYEGSTLDAAKAQLVSQGIDHFVR